MKTYISHGRSLTIFIIVNGVQRMIRFRDMGSIKNYGLYSTDNPETIKRLEADPRFNQQYFLIEPQAEEETETPKEEYSATFPDIHRTQEAKKILVSKYGIDGDSIATKADALEIAKQLNINFPNL